MSAKTANLPMIFRYSDSWESFASIKMKVGDPSIQLALIEKTYDANFPNSPFNFFFLDEKFDHQYQADRRFQAVLAFWLDLP